MGNLGLSVSPPKVGVMPLERPFFPGPYLTIVYNYKTITVQNNSLNPAHPIAVAQAKPQPKDQM